MQESAEMSCSSLRQILEQPIVHKLGDDIHHATELPILHHDPDLDSLVNWHFPPTSRATIDVFRDSLFRILNEPEDLDRR